MDDHQRARELLLAEFNEDAREAFLRGGFDAPVCVTVQSALRAITAALRAAPEGFVMVPEEPTVDMQVATLGKNWPAMSPQSVWAAMLAAYQQEQETSAAAVQQRNDT